jgi:MFS family permease
MMPASPLRSRTLIAYLVSRFCSGAAMMMLRAGIGWHVYALTESPFQLGLIGLVQFLPGLALMLVGGAIADTRDRRRTMMIAQSVTMTTAIVLCVATGTGTVTLPLLYALVVVVAAAAAFDNPARAALLPTLVPREVFPRVVTIAATTQALSFATGPALGGVLIGTVGIPAVYGTYALLVAGSIASLALLGPRPPLGGPARAVSLNAILEGLRFVRRQPVVLGCMTLDMLAVIFGGATALLPVYATNILHVDAHGYGLLASSLELGALLTSIALVFLPTVRRAGPVLLVAVVVYGCATIVFGASRWFPLSIAAYMVVGIADQVSVVLRSTAIQLSTPDEMRGRVSAVNFVFIGASNQLGAAESGFVAALTSAPFAVVSGGVACLVVVAAIAAVNPALRRYRVELRA